MVNHRQTIESRCREGDAEELARRAADDALITVLGRLSEFRGSSRFTTWAYKFVLLDAAAKVRRRAWQGREVQLASVGWTLIADDHPNALVDLGSGELLVALQDAIESDLSPHQRDVFVATTFNDIPDRCSGRAARDDSRGSLRDHPRSPPEAPRRTRRPWVRRQTDLIGFSRRH